MHVRAIVTCLLLAAGASGCGDDGDTAAITSTSTTTTVAHDLGPLDCAAGAACIEGVAVDGETWAHLCYSVRTDAVTAEVIAAGELDDGPATARAIDDVDPSLALALDRDCGASATGWSFIVRDGAPVAESSAVVCDATPDPCERAS